MENVDSTMVENMELSQMEVVNNRVFSSQKAFQKYSKANLNERKKIINAIKSTLIPYAKEIAEKEYIETGMGNIEDKIIKLVLAIHKTPGVEDLVTETMTGDDGMTIHELSAYGVVVAIHPGTNPIATLINNTIGALAAGNSIINIPNPRCIGVSNYVNTIINKAIYDVSGIKNLVMTVPESSMSLAEEIMNHPDVSLVIATGGRKMLNHALKTPKRVIAAGEANPVVIVDNTAKIDKAVEDIVNGASFDNNIMCISEKCIVIDDQVTWEFVEELKKNNVFYIDDDETMLKLTKRTLTSDMKMNRELEGKSANEILKESGIYGDENIKLIVVNTIKKHPFVTEEMLMPLVPLVEVKNFDEALETALFVEQGFRHTAMIHSQSIDNLNRAAKIMQTTVFIKNGSSLSGIGLKGEEKASFTIANITGEGMTTARDFAVKRSCTLTSGFSIR